MATTFKKLQSKWYRKLEKDGFKDIENTKSESRPLKEWHSFKKPKNDLSALYQGQIEGFINHLSFNDACKSLVAHGNCKFTEKQIRLVWEYHIDGVTVRKTAKILNRSKSCVWDVIKGLKQWMKLT